MGLGAVEGSWQPSESHSTVRFKTTPPLQSLERKPGFGLKVVCIPEGGLPQTHDGRHRLLNHQVALLLAALALVGHDGQAGRQGPGVVPPHHALQPHEPAVQAEHGHARGHGVQVDLGAGGRGGRLAPLLLPEVALALGDAEERQGLQGAGVRVQGLGRGVGGGVGV